MIKFACTCHTTLEVSDEFAGTSLQCPKCKRLVDVPTLSDLKGLDDDGAYKLDALKLRDEPDRLANLQRAYAPQRRDHRGKEIDLREKFKGNGASISDDDVLDVLDAEPVPPKYDPETGELVRAVPLKHEPVKFDPSTLPVAKAVINYATGAAARPFNGGRIFAEIFRPANLAVAGIVMVACIALQLMYVPMSIGLWMIAPGFFIVCFAIAAHFSNVVNDMSVEGSDELPRPLRDLSWHDDIWWPFLNFVMALALCYGPAILSSHLPQKAQAAYAGAILVTGTIGFPAVFLTTSTSGTILNLAPDKVLNVIGAIGLRYVLMVLIWSMALVTGVVGVVTGASQLAISMGGIPMTRALKLPLPLSNGLIVLGILLMHGFCWYLSLQYRAHHEEFKWFYQRHHRTIESVQQPSGVATATPSIAPPMATAIAPPSVRSSDYPQSHA